MWYLGGASVPPGPVIPRVENADLNLMPIIDSHNPEFKRGDCPFMETLHDKVDEAILKSGGMTAHSWRHFMTRLMKLS